MTDLVVDDAVKAGMDAVRNGSNDWILLGFATPDDSTKLVVLGTGTGGVEAMAGAVPATDVGYGVVKRDFVLDEAQGMGKTKVLKFLRVTWRPEAKLSLKRKMKMGTLDGQIKKVLGSTHADLEFDDPSQMVDKVVVDLIERITQKADMVSAAAGKEVSSFFNSGTAVQARTAAGDKAAAARKHDAFMDPSHLTGQAKGAEFEWQDLDAIKAAIARVRDDADPTTWMTAGYVDKKTIALFDTGAGADPVPEVTASFRDATLCFGLFRVTERIDKTTAVRFVFVTWQPEDIPVMARASQATHRGGVVPVFRPFHVDFSISSRSELTLDGVMDTIMKQSGTKSMVTDAKPAHKEEVYVRKMLGGVKEEIVPVDFVDKDALEQAVKAVRSDADPTAWVVATYAQKDGKNLAVQLKASGAGGVPEFAAALCDEPDNTAYGLVRVQQTIDDRTSAVKFVFVTYQGSAMASMFKAKVSTLRGAILPVFTPYHAEMFVDSAGEVTDASVQERLR